VFVSAHVGDPVDTGLAVGVGDASTVPVAPVAVALDVG
jgi:hypothetical protein